MIYEYPNFLTPSECLTIIGLGESDKLKSGGTSNNSYGYRKAKIRWISEEPIIDEICKKISVLTNTDIEKQETFHFIKYSERGEYKPHYDGMGRVKTAMIYLNDGFKGGETFFVNIDRTIKPEVGKLIIWDNLDQNGNLDKDSFHAGLPVEFGNKYIAVIWIKK
jgi:prolyl 4-hydroxylase